MTITILYAIIVVVSAFIQSTLGFGFVILSMAFFPIFYGYSKAIALNMAIVVLSTFIVSFRLRKHIQWKAMTPILIPTLIIHAATILLAVNISSGVMYTLLGFMLIASSVYFFIFSEKIKLNPTPVSAGIMGILCGIFYGLFGIGGPTAALYLMPSVKNNEEYLATIQGFLFVNNMLSFVLRIILGNIVFSDMPLIGLGWAAMLIGTALGLWVFKKIPVEAFKKIVYAFVGVNGLWIVISNLI